MFNTTAGPISVSLFSNEAPRTVKLFLSLVRSGYYSSHKHRSCTMSHVVPDSLLQLPKVKHGSHVPGSHLGLELSQVVVVCF